MVGTSRNECDERRPKKVKHSDANYTLHTPHVEVVGFHVTRVLRNKRRVTCSHRSSNASMSHMYCVEVAM